MGRHRAKRREYAAYQGDRFIDLGTAEYLAKKLGISPQTVEWRASPSGLKRSAKYDMTKSVVIKIEDEENEL